MTLAVLEGRRKSAEGSPLKSWFMVGFECSTHRRRDGRRLDVIAATRHDQMAQADYRLAASLGLATLRDGTLWHLIERTLIATTGRACCRWCRRRGSPASR